MKTAQHTPGPWQYGIGNDGASIVSGDVVIGHTFEPDDARLIAAAPDLLAALQQCIQSIRAMPRTKQAEDIQAECGMFSASAAARDAIAKATGADHAR